MGREVRRVPAGWQHPKDEERPDRYKPLFPNRYAEDAAEFLSMVNKSGLQSALEEFGRAPDRNDYMPEWPESEATHLMMYETCSEGTPISPAFSTPEELADWLAATNASWFGSQGADREAWLGVAQGGYGVGLILFVPGSGS